MSGTAFDFIAAIEDQSQGFAAAAAGNLAATVTGCPGWTVADLTRHLTEVQWFWSTIVAERLHQPPDESRRPPPAGDDSLIRQFLEGSNHLVEVLSAANPEETVWTWAPAQQNVAFVIRHQVQEAAIHRWDADQARGGTFAIPTPLAADSIEEFLTFSVSSTADPADPVGQPLQGSLSLECTEIKRSWTICDGSSAGTLSFDCDVEPAATKISATASELLLWLYGRISLPSTPDSPELMERFRALCFTD